MTNSSKTKEGHGTAGVTKHSRIREKASLPDAQVASVDAHLAAIHALAAARGATDETMEALSSALTSARRLALEGPTEHPGPNAPTRHGSRLLTREERLMANIDTALQPFVDYRRKGSAEAFDVARNAIHALVTGKPEWLETARRLWERQHGVVDSTGATLLEIDNHVRTALGRIAQGTPLADAARWLSVVSADRFGAVAPSANDIQGWLSRHGERGTRGREGKITAPGIVALIAHRVEARRNETIDGTRERVKKALSQDRHPHW